MSVRVRRAEAKAKTKPDTTLPRSARLAGHLGQMCMLAERVLEAPMSEVCRESLRLATERAREALDNREER